MTSLVQKYRRLTCLKFCFAKDSPFAEQFAADIGACSMYITPGFGLNIPTNLSPENQLWGIFNEVTKQHGIFLFNISGVDLKKSNRGFKNYLQAETNNQITEWELSIILTNRDYLKNCIFHNGKVQFKKQKIC